MTHPAKPAPLEPLDEPIWLALLSLASDATLQIDIDLDDPHDAARMLAAAGVLVSSPDANAALERIAATGRIERCPTGLRVCAEVVTRKPYVAVYGALTKSALWTAASVEVRTLWMHLLLSCDADGVVHLQPSELADGELLTPEAVDIALAWLVSDGRVERLPNGTLRLPRYRETHRGSDAAHDEDRHNGSTKKPQGQRTGRDD